MKSSVILLIAHLLFIHSAMAGHSDIHTQCDSLIFNPTTDVYLQKDCETYYQERLDLIPKKEVKKKKTPGKKPVPYVDSVKKVIEQIVDPYEWSDKGVRLQFLADYIYEAPSFKKTVWDDSTIDTAYIKGPSGCKPVILTKSKAGYSGYIKSATDTINDTLHTAKEYFFFKEALHITKAISTVLSKAGDTISFFSLDKEDEVGTISGVTDKYIEFSGRRVFLRAVCNQKDTLEVEYQNHIKEKCILCRGISIITGTLDKDYGTVGGKRNSIFSIDCDENPCRKTEVPVAMYLINSTLKDKPFFTGSATKGPRIYTSCEACEKDEGKYYFPDVD